jgi:uncharacterized protein
MQVYLPIAEMSVNLWVLLAIGGGVGFLSGLFGVGGGFLLTPLLIFLGIPPAVAVSSQASQIAAVSVSGALSHWQRKAVDVSMGMLLLGGGLIGSAAGVILFAWLSAIGQIDTVISIAYVVFLSFVGTIMAKESLSTIARARFGGPQKPKRRHLWIHNMPFKQRFPRSGLYISSIPPVAIGFVVGLLAAIMGVGGGFIMIPAMLYLLRMPTRVMVGTSLFQIVFLTLAVSMMQAVVNQTVDLVLAAVLIFGGVIGAQLGVRAGYRLKAEYLRALLALLVLGLGAKLAFDLINPPLELFEVLS